MNFECGIVVSYADVAAFCVISVNAAMFIFRCHYVIINPLCQGFNCSKYCCSYNVDITVINCCSKCSVFAAAVWCQCSSKYFCRLM